MEYLFDKQVIIRLFNPDVDLSHLISFYIDTKTSPEQATQLAEMAWPGHNPAQDRWVAELAYSPNHFIGYAYTFMRSPGEAVVQVIVQSAWRRRGLGSALLNRVFNRAQEKGAAYAIAAVWEPDQAGEAFLRHHGFSLAGHSRYLYSSANLALAEPEWPAGFTVRAYSEIQHLPTLLAAKNRSYGDMFGHGEQRRPDTLEELAPRMVENPNLYPPESTFIAFAPDGSVAGICKGLLEKGKKGEPKMIIDGPGIVPEHRHLELQRPLILTVMRWLCQYGSGPVELHSFGDEERTVEIYQELGFTLEAHLHRLVYKHNFQSTL